MVIVAAAERRDHLAWQIARGVRGTNIRTYEEFSGRSAEGAGSALPKEQSADEVAWRFRLWRQALKAKFRTAPA